MRSCASLRAVFNRLGLLAWAERPIVKDQETVARFIQRRAQSWTGDRISTGPAACVEDVLDWQV